MQTLTQNLKYPGGTSSVGPQNQTFITDQNGFEYDIAERKTLWNVFKFESDELD